MIDKNIRIAATPPGSFYLDAGRYKESVEKIFARCWHLIGHTSQFDMDNMFYPAEMMPGCLNEPIIVAKQNGAFNMLSNVCTHRGYILVNAPTKVGPLRCKYHGRCFSPDGSCTSMPEFEEAENFPTRMDNLSKVPFREWGGFLFASVFPAMDFSEVIGDIQQRLNWFSFDNLKYSAQDSRIYAIRANWALYCDNYLEGLHIPFVHKSLKKVIDYPNYETHLFPYCNLQLGIAKEGELAFELPPGSADYGKRVGAYYYWVFPNMMLNFYPWGLSVNIVEPLSVAETRIRFETYIADPSKFNRGAGSDLHRVELEDEAVVESVQRGVQSRFYSRGRYSPKMEKGVHHFHRLVQEFMQHPR